MNISVYITSYNQSGFLKEAIDSVLAQTLKPFEIIIIDDLSTDGSRELIDSYKIQYPQIIKTIFNERNVGISYCRNLGLENAKGDYITCLDGDDIYLPLKLEKQAELLNSGTYNCVFTNFYYCKENIRDIYKVWCSNISELPSPGRMYKEVITRRFPQNALFRYELFDLSLIQDIGFYDVNLKIYEDYDFRIRLSRVAKCNYIFEPLSVYRIHENGLSKASNEKHFKSLSYIFNKYTKELEGLPPQEAAFINEEMKRILDLFSPNNQFNSDKPSFKSKAKKGIIKLIDKF